MDEVDVNTHTELRDSHDEKHTIIDQLDSGRGSYREQQQIYLTHDNPMQARYSVDMPLQGDDLSRHGLPKVSLK